MTTTQSYFEYPFIPRIDAKDVQAYVQKTSPVGVERVTQVSSPYAPVSNVQIENAQSAFIPGMACSCGNLTVDNTCLRPGATQSTPFTPDTEMQRAYFAELWQGGSRSWQGPASRAMEYRAAPRN